MADFEVMSIMENACNYSLLCGCPIYVMSNGETLAIADEEILDDKKDFEAVGYWVSCIFENGYKIDL